MSAGWLCFHFSHQRRPGKSLGKRCVLGIHVDDGIGGGDQYFLDTIDRLREKYSFGDFNIGEFDFCEIH